MTFTPHPELPGFPTHTFDVIHKEHYYFKSATGRSSRECELTLQFRTVPGQTVATIESDLKRLLARIKQDHPAFNCVLEIPARGTEQTWNQRRWSALRITLWSRALAEGQSFGLGAGRRRRRPWAPRQRRRRQHHPGSARYPDRAIRSRRHPHLQGMANTRRAGTLWPTSSRPPKRSRMPRSDCAADSSAAVGWAKARPSPSPACARDWEKPEHGSGAVAYPQEKISSVLNLSDRRSGPSWRTMNMSWMCQ